MKKQFILLFTLFTLCTTAWAQKQYKLTKKTGRLNIHLGGAIVEGYEGSEIIFTVQNEETEAVDERAKGLKAISGSGFTDNTGLGLDVTVEGDDVNVNPIGRKSQGILSIKVPNTIKVSVTTKSNMRSEELIIRNIKSEIEVSTTYNKIKLEDNTGPMNVKTMYGSVDARFDGVIKGPVSIISVYSYVDVSMPAATKAKVELGTLYGKLYAAEEFKIVRDKKDVEAEKVRSGTANGLTFREFDSVGARSVTSGGTVYVSGSDNLSRTINFSREAESIKGTINGGGTDLIFKSNYNNVYLRQK
jgi:hypothetical protein